MTKATSYLPLSPAASPKVRAAVEAVDVVRAKKALYKRRRYRKVFLDHPSAFDRIKPGLSDLPPGPRNDALRAFVACPDGPVRVEPECVHAALVVARALCWLDLRR